MAMNGTTFDIEVIAAGAGKIQSFHDSATIFRPGERGDCAYIVTAGKVEMVEKGRAVELLSKGEIFGELALLDNEPRTATAVACGPVELIPIDRALFEVLMRDDSDFALTIVQLLARSLRATMKVLESCVEDLKTATDTEGGEGAGEVRQAG